MPSIELRDWLFNDLLLTLWESKPMFQMVKLEEGSEVETERVIIDEVTGLPAVETVCKGVTKVSVYSWLKKSPLAPTYSAS